MTGTPNEVEEWEDKGPFGEGPWHLIVIPKEVEGRMLACQGKESDGEHLWMLYVLQGITGHETSKSRSVIGS